MRKKSEAGFTLIEMIVVIAIMGIVASLATYSINIVFDGNTKSFANQFASATRSVRDKTLSSKKQSLKVEVGYDITRERYYYKIESSSDGTNIEEVWIKKDVSVKKLIEAELKTLQDIGSQTIAFDKSTGRASSGSGKYIFENKITGKQVGVNIVGKTGSVIIDD